MRVILLPMFCLVNTIVSSENPCESSSTTDPIVNVCENSNTTMATTVYMYTRNVPIGAAKCFCYAHTNAKELGLKAKFTLSYVQPGMTQNLSFGVLGMDIRQSENPVVGVMLYVDWQTEIHYVSTKSHTASEKACFKIQASVEHLMVNAECTNWWSAPAIPTTTATTSNHTDQSTDQTNNNATSNGTEERIPTTSTDTPPHSISDEDWVACCVIIGVVVILVLIVSRRHRNREVAQTNADPPIHQTRSHSIYHTRSPSIHHTRSPSIHMPTLHDDSLGYN